jgi:hypothetical protein
MSQMSSSGSSRPRGSADNDVYTTLMVVAFLFVLIATIFVGYKAMTLFGGLMPPPGT